MRGLVAFSLLIVASLPAKAIDITVNLLGDPVPNGCTPGSCSLREAVSLANNLAGPDRIFLPATPNVPLQLTIPGGSDNANASGDLDVLDDLEIIGTGVNTTTLVQTAADRVLETFMDVDQRLVLRGMTIQGGNASYGGGLSTTSLVTIEDVAFVGNGATISGGAILYTGMIAPSIAEHRLVLRRVRFENNDGSGNGGALSAVSNFNDAPFVLIEDCEFIGNQAEGGGGAISLNGNPNDPGGGVIIRRSHFSNNTSSGTQGGAAILATSSTYELLIEDSLFEANVTTGGGPFSSGAISFFEIQSADVLRTTFSSNSGAVGGALASITGPTRLIDCHFFNNSASRGGGAVWGEADLVVEHSTFNANSVSSTDSNDFGGGAILFSGYDNLMSIKRSTFSGNDAFRGGAISLDGGRMQLYGSTLVANSSGIPGRAATVMRILDNEASNALVVANSIISGTCTFPNLDRQLTVAYNNIESPTASCRFGTATVSAQNQTAVSSAQIALGPLADNGGPTLTRLPGPGSIAINQGRESYCTPTDQRHFLRADAVCDIGAVEVGATVPTEDVFRNGFE